MIRPHPHYIGLRKYIRQFRVSYVSIIMPSSTSKEVKTVDLGKKSETTEFSKSKREKEKEKDRKKKQEEEEEEEEVVVEEEDEEDEEDEDEEASFTTTDILGNDPLYFVLSKIFMTSSEPHTNVADLLRELIDKLDTINKKTKA